MEFVIDVHNDPKQGLVGRVDDGDIIKAKWVKLDQLEIDFTRSAISEELFLNNIKIKHKDKQYVQIKHADKAKMGFMLPNDTVIPYAVYSKRK